MQVIVITRFICTSKTSQLHLYILYILVLKMHTSQVQNFNLYFKDFKCNAHPYVSSMIS